VEQTSAQNRTWDVREQAARLTVPVHVLGADPEVYSLFTGRTAEHVLRNPVASMSIVRGAGHSPHRDKPEQTMRQLLEVLA
jgi:pimeloyl-ACP methyl ester carboxylesterase